MPGRGGRSRLLPGKRRRRVRLVRQVRASSVLRGPAGRRVPPDGSQPYRPRPAGPGGSTYQGRPSTGYQGTPRPGGFGTPRPGGFGGLRVRVDLVRPGPVGAAVRRLDVPARPRLSGAKVRPRRAACAAPVRAARKKRSRLLKRMPRREPVVALSKSCCARRVLSRACSGPVSRLSRQEGRSQCARSEQGNHCSGAHHCQGSGRSAWHQLR